MDVMTCHVQMYQQWRRVDERCGRFFIYSKRRIQPKTAERAQEEGTNMIPFPSQYTSHIP